MNTTIEFTEQELAVARRVLEAVSRQHRYGARDTVLLDCSSRELDGKGRLSIQLEMHERLALERAAGKLTEAELHGADGTRKCHCHCGKVGCRS